MVDLTRELFPDLPLAFPTPAKVQLPGTAKVAGLWPAFW